MKSSRGKHIECESSQSLCAVCCGRLREWEATGAKVCHSPCTLLAGTQPPPPLLSLHSFNMDQEDNRHKHKDTKTQRHPIASYKSVTYCVVDCSLYSCLPLLLLSQIKRQTDTDNDNRNDKQTKSPYQRCIKLLPSLPATTQASLSSFPVRQR